MKNLFLILLALLTLAFSPVFTNAMCIYSESSPRENPSTKEILDSLYVTFDPGFFHHQYNWQISIGSDTKDDDYKCVPSTSGLACVSLTTEWFFTGAFNCCHVEEHGCVFINKDFPEDCRDPGEPFGGWKNCPSIKCITNAECN
jgi:hypothetical protein